MYDYTIETFTFGPDDRVRVIYDDEPTQFLGDLLANGLSLHCINGGGWPFDKLPSGEDSHADALDMITDHAEYDDNEEPLTKHFARAGLAFKVTSFTSGHSFMGAYIAYGENADIEQKWIEQDCATIQQMLDGEVYTLVHEKRTVYASVNNPEATLDVWNHEDRCDGFIGMDIADLKYAAVEHFALPEQFNR